MNGAGSTPGALVSDSLEAAAIVTPTIIPRPEHNISRANISESALKVLYRLKNSGYDAYLVGGGVRDLLLGREPKDFDVATSALPEEVRAVFRNCRLIGRRFRLAHVTFGREIIEVATFRGPSNAEDGEGLTENGMLVSDNVYGTLEEDALRRDFTINALYYNIEDYSVVDYAGGMRDLRTGVLRLLGDPEQRYREDPVRMLRAVRFASKLGFTIDDTSEGPLRQLGDLLEGVPPARLFEEVLKLFLAGYGVQTFEKLRHYDLFSRLFPATETALAREEQGFPITFVTKGLANTDRRIRDGLPVTPAFLFAVLLWEPLRVRLRQLGADGDMNRQDALQLAAGDVLAEQASRVAIPKRFSLPMREIWTLQDRFEMTRGRRPARLAAHPRFRAGYDFLLLRAEAGEVDPQLADWWTRFQQSQGETPQEATAATGERGPRRRRRRRRKKEA